jgi:outer membrane phospholipase A
MRACVSVLVAAALASGAARGEMILLPPQGEVAGGGSVRIDLLITNEDSGARTYTVPEQLRLRLNAHGAAFNVTLDLDAEAPRGAVELPPGTFRRIAYRGHLPEALSGNVSAQAQDLDAAPSMFAVAPGALAAEASRAIAAETTGTARDVPAGQAPGAAAGVDPAGTFFSALSPYEPVYAAVGEREGWNAKFQLSLKFRFFPRDAPVVKHVDFLQDLYFGYTQTSLWDLESASKPFFDSSYKPRVFFFDPNVWRLDPSVVAGVEGGLGHESNGRGGAESRSVNIAYIKPILTLGAPGGWQWTLAPMLYDYLDKEDNPDIQEYRGYVDLYASVGKPGKWKLAGTFRHGTGAGWSSELNLSYPLRSVALGNLNGYLLLQYFDGWGESLVAYNQRLPAQYRLGLMVVR